jgi:hypothetical protein
VRFANAHRTRALRSPPVPALRGLEEAVKECLTETQ